MDHSDHQDLSGFLRRLLLRSKLTQEEQDAILSLRGTTVHVLGHRDLVRPGEKVDHSCLVTEGLVGQYDQMADGSRQITSFFIAGDMADLKSMICPIAGWGIVALTKATVVKIPHSALVDIATRFPAIGRAFWRDTVVDGAILSKWVAVIGRKSARARIAHLLCEMGLRMADAGLDSSTDYAFPVTQEQLGDAMGLTAVHVNRMLRDLSREGVADFQRSRVKVLDVRLLHSIAEFNPQFLLLDPA